MGKYDFIKLGNLLYWHDPDSGLSNGVYQMASIPENIEEDSVILIASDTSEAEVFLLNYHRYIPVEVIKKTFCVGKQNVKLKVLSFTTTFPK